VRGRMVGRGRHLSTTLKSNPTKSVPVFRDCPGRLGKHSQLDWPASQIDVARCVSGLWPSLWAGLKPGCTLYKRGFGCGSPAQLLLKFGTLPLPRRRIGVGRSNKISNDLCCKLWITIITVKITLKSQIATWITVLDSRG
jgi:hypothetical protein